MKWAHLSSACRMYLSALYVISVPFAYLCFKTPSPYPLIWVLLTLTSVFVSTVNVRLPKISSVISMGDVFTILALTQFGPGPALITYWLAIIAAHLTDVIRRFGINGLTRVMFYRLAFNLACCALSVWVMSR